MHRDGSSSTWHQPDIYRTTKQRCNHFGGYSKTFCVTKVTVTHSESHTTRAQQICNEAENSAIVAIVKSKGSFRNEAPSTSVHLKMNILVETSAHYVRFQACLRPHFASPLRGSSKQTPAAPNAWMHAIWNDAACMESGIWYDAACMESGMRRHAWNLESGMTRDAGNLE